jgi:hypothetical protein
MKVRTFGRSVPNGTTRHCPREHPSLSAKIVAIFMFLDGNR